MRAVAAAALVVLCLAPGRAARAHHVLPPYGLVPMPRASAALDGELGTVSYEGTRAWWVVAAPSLEWQLVERWSVWGRLPLARVEWADGRRATGPGDLELGTKVRAWTSASERVTLAMGASLELPTGDHDDALGAGHIDAAAFLAPVLSWPVGGEGRVAVFGVLAERGSLVDLSHHGSEPEPLVHGAIIGLHSRNELVGRIMAGYLREPWSFLAGAETIAVLAGGGAWGPTMLRVEVGVEGWKRLHVTAGWDQTVAGPARADRRVRMALVWSF